MRLFVDANVLIAVLNKEYPLFNHAARILSLSDDRNTILYTSPLCLAIAFYFAEKKSGSTIAKKKIEMLSKRFEIAPMSASAVNKALNNRRAYDFEDGLQYYAAAECSCNCIITEDKSGFYFSDLEVLTCETYLKIRLK